ncbi:hypothetical protein M8J77_009551 [Diaphorina citri]|nr:hypothetical protein M8J77_009551 [Diaphorina citri]
MVVELRKSFTKFDQQLTNRIVQKHHLWTSGFTVLTYSLCSPDGPLPRKENYLGKLSASEPCGKHKVSKFLSASNEKQPARKPTAVEMAEIDQVADAIDDAHVIIDDYVNNIDGYIDDVLNVDASGTHVTDDHNNIDVLKSKHRNPTPCLSLVTIKLNHRRDLHLTVLTCSRNVA